MPLAFEGGWAAERQEHLEDPLLSGLHLGSATHVQQPCLERLSPRHLTRFLLPFRLGEACAVLDGRSFTAQAHAPWLGRAITKQASSAPYLAAQSVRPNDSTERLDQARNSIVDWFSSHRGRVQDSISTLSAAPLLSDHHVRPRTVQPVLLARTSITTAAGAHHYTAWVPA